MKTTCPPAAFPGCLLLAVLLMVTGLHADAEVASPAAVTAGFTPEALVHEKSPNGSLSTFHLDVASVTCGDGACAVVTVRLHWNTLGRYVRYELPHGCVLTKQGHASFSDADHAKLHAVLLDRDSPLRHFEKEKVIAPDLAVQGVDAITGATPDMYENDVVPGAVYTCYTLWHWANGDVADHIRKLAEKTCTDAQLVAFIESGDESSGVFAIEQLAKRRRHDEATLDAVIGGAEDGSTALVRAALEYLQSTTSETNADIYYLAIERLFPTAEKQNRLLYLGALSKVKRPPPSEYYDRISKWIPLQTTYYEVHLLLNFLEAGAAISTRATEQVMAVLDNSNFLIARRAFWYLENQQLTPSQKKRMDAFRLTYHDRL